MITEQLMNNAKAIVLIVCLFLLNVAAGQERSKVWSPDLGNGKFKNPVLYADYSDPDVIRVGDDYYMTASSFNCVPGLPILHSRDLVNWEIINYALPRLDLEGIPAGFFDKPQHGKGVWAPCIRYHRGQFLIYWGDPDFGIYVVRSTDIRGAWSKPILVLPGRGRIDPSPLFDDDGRIYLVHAWADSRAKMNSVMMVCELDSTGTKVINDQALVFDGNDGINHTVEGGKFYKKDGYYYLLAPAGGVATGWQIALRSKEIYGPYEVKTVLAQGATDINGPHQGGLVDTKSGEWWFLHFQDVGAIGRIVHLQPVQWKDGWPVMGTNDKNYCGEPVSAYRKPDVGQSYPVKNPLENDEFDKARLGLQWSWHANPGQTWAFPSTNGYLRLYGQYYPQDYRNLWQIPNLLLQKITAPQFKATTKMKVVLKNEDDMAGFLIMGWDYGYIALKKNANGYEIVQVQCRDAEQNGTERVSANKQLKDLKPTTKYNYQTKLEEVDLWIRTEVDLKGDAQFKYSCDGRVYLPLGDKFHIRQGKWIGAKMGYFILNGTVDSARSWADIDWFRVE
ncbi:glycoside hydrolase 43 family protein [Sphingobacterium thalpophilum]|uniref:glycoside hydrolase family 43 protein n=1 Tax=Sphingobacterium thalpophilum TaxID=259 RepID=UPI0037DA0D8C